MDAGALLHQAADRAAKFLDTVSDAPVRPDVTDAAALRSALVGRLPDTGADASAVLDELVAAASPGIMGSQSPRFFGFV
ncbi:MAG: aspartate aminotransferase family protein, partial [Aldersonia sp.]|nr:aspartate aminotransferase family protein [Aldersonia sp.]